MSGPSTLHVATTRPLTSRTSSLANAVSASARQEDYVDQDALFTKHTVAEIRVVQRRLRTDADGKQEELRLMVGERYRDLLQASASIISIAQSSRNVLDALDEMKLTVQDHAHVRLHKRTVSSKQDDSRLRTLQSLAAHVKLLLDTPEHLWRLLERKRYLHAGWLFLLARVVHRSLASEDMEDEEGWQSQGIDILDQFPLAQKQWDTIAHFRPQITHKATLSLRETNISTEDVCATLLTLHLIDSRPLTETLSVFITQRSKALQILLNRKVEQTFNSKAVGPTDAGMKGKSFDKPRLKTRKVVAREVWQALEAVLDAISGTINAARDIFQEHGAEHPSLIHRVLDYVAKDESSAFADTLPSNLRLSTQRFLTTLPSSSHFLLLPSNLREYKPYVDLASSSASVAQPELSRKLEDWFRSATEQLKGMVQAWFLEMESVRQVWAVRRWARESLQSSAKLEGKEKAHIAAILDDVCQSRVVGIWTLALDEMECSLRTALKLAITNLSEAGKLDAASVSPLQYLLKYSTQGSPAFGSTTASSIASFEKYKDQLRSQLAARTPLLDQVLSPLESRTHRLKRDLTFMESEEDGHSLLGMQLMENYYPDAEALCGRISSALASETEHALNTSSDALIPVVVLIGHVADELASTSDFITAIGIRPAAGIAFCETAQHLHIRAIDRWLEHTVSEIITKYQRSSQTAAIGLSISPDQDSTDSSRPSASMLHALLSLSTSLQELGLHRDSSKWRRTVEGSVGKLVAGILDMENVGALQASDQQVLSDLYLLCNLAEQWSPALEETRALLYSKTSTLQQKLSADGYAVLPSKEGSADHLARAQLILDALLPPRLLAPSNANTVSPLVRLGMPSSEQQFLSAMDLAKPSARFGLLLVVDTGL